MGKAEQTTDGELVARCREGDESAWAELVERFSGYVYAILARGFRLTGHEAEDVFQEVFARLYERLDSLKDDDAVRPWIAQTARRLAIDRHRAAAREGPAAGELPEEAAVDERIERLDEALVVRAGLAALPENCRQVLLAFFIRDQSYEAISVALEIPSGTIASRISRCLERLRTELAGSSAPATASGESKERA